MRDIVSVKKMVLLFVATFVIGFIILGINVAGEESTVKSNRAYYHELEARFRNVLEAKLERHGYHNTGINISSVINADGRRTYTVSLHNDRFDYMSESDRDYFLNDLASVAFADNETPVIYEIF